MATTNPDQWKIDMGQTALKVLVKEGIISNPENWNDKMLDAPQNWLFFTMLQRMIEKK
ncbi:hypothetical protein D3C71_2109700 [compost metagenome]